MERTALPVSVAVLVSVILAPRLARLTLRTSRERGYWTIRGRRHYATHFNAASCRKGVGTPRRMMLEKGGQSKWAKNVRAEDASERDSSTRYTMFDIVE